MIHWPLKVVMGLWRLSLNAHFLPTQKLWPWPMLPIQHCWPIWPMTRWLTVISAATTDEWIQMRFGTGLTRVAQGSMYYRVIEIPHGKGRLLGLSGPLKSIVSHCCVARCKKSIKASQRHCSSALVGVTLHCPPVKNLSPCNAAFHQYSLTTCSNIQHPHTHAPQLLI